MAKMILIREWDSDKFHDSVMKLEAEGFVTKLETYQIEPESDPDTGKIIHLYTIEMHKQDN